MEEKEKQIKKGMKVLVGIFTIIACAAIAYTAFDLFYKKPKTNEPEVKEPDKKEEKEEQNEEVEEKDATSEEIEIMQKISEYIFDEEKETFDISMLTNQEKISAAFYFSGKNVEESTGNELINVFNKYFGKSENLVLEDAICSHPLHEDNETKINYKYDASIDKYVSNPTHPGHGGGSGEEKIVSHIYSDKFFTKDGKYYYMAKVVFFNNVLCGDTGPCSYDKVYASYLDAKNEVNSLVDIKGNQDYMDPILNIEQPDYDKLYQDYGDKLSVYQFEFEKEDRNLIFKNYKKI